MFDIIIYTEKYLQVNTELFAFDITANIIITLDVPICVSKSPT